MIIIINNKFLVFVKSIIFIANQIIPEYEKDCFTNYIF